MLHKAISKSQILEVLESVSTWLNEIIRAALGRIKLAVRIVQYIVRTNG